LLAFADAVRRRFPDVRITTLGSPKGMENELIPPTGYDLRVIPAFQLPRAVNLDLLRTPDRMYKSAHAAGKVIDEGRAEGVGGFWGGGWGGWWAWAGRCRSRPPSRRGGATCRSSSTR